MYKELKDVGLYWSSDRPEQELRDRCSWEQLVTGVDIKDIQDKNTVATKDFFDDFQRWNDGL